MSISNGQSKRDLKQEEGAKLWLDSNRKGTILFGTGVGKSKLTMLILEKLQLQKTARILLLVDSEDLRDKNWKADFEKWGHSNLWTQIQAECYQTVYKWKDTSWDLVIADEFDFSLTPEYAKFYTNNKYEALLGLTGFIDKPKMVMANNIAPVVCEYSTQQAQNDDILNKTQLVLVEYDLDRGNKNYEVKFKSGGKDKSFLQTENAAYEYIDAQYIKAREEIQVLQSDTNVLLGFDLDGFARVDKLQRKLKILANKRQLLLYNSKTSILKTKHVLKELLKNENNKILVFSAFTSQADAIQDDTFHTKNKKGNTFLEQLSDGEIRSVGVCKAINRGKNLVGVNCIVMESYDSSPTSFTQRHGRGCRLEADATMFLYVMLPYYYKEVADKVNPGQTLWERRPTQMVTWASKMMSEFQFKNPMKITI